MRGPFAGSVEWYDTVYAELDYRSHAAWVMEHIVSRMAAVPASLLDVACGTGRHLEIWAADVPHLEGADIDPGMLRLAAARLPGVLLHQSDMRSLDLDGRFDAATCLFSSIGYMRTPADLHGAVAAMARHLRPGGVLVVEPWLRPGVFVDGAIRHQVVERDGVTIARTSRSRLASPGQSWMEFAYLVTTEDGSTFHTEIHEMGLFTPEQHVSALEAAGLTGEFVEGGILGRGLAIGVR